MSAAGTFLKEFQSFIIDIADKPLEVGSVFITNGNFFTLGSLFKIFEKKLSTTIILVVISPILTNFNNTLKLLGEFLRR